MVVNIMSFIGFFTMRGLVANCWKNFSFGRRRAADLGSNEWSSLGRA